MKECGCACVWMWPCARSVVKYVVVCVGVVTVSLCASVCFPLLMSLRCVFLCRCPLCVHVMLCACLCVCDQPSAHVRSLLCVCVDAISALCACVRCGVRLPLCECACPHRSIAAETDTRACYRSPTVDPACTHANDLTVTCLNHTIARLVDGEGNTHTAEGRVELHHAGLWGSVCGDSQVCVRVRVCGHARCCVFVWACVAVCVLLVCVLV